MRKRPIRGMARARPVTYYRKSPTNYARIAQAARRFQRFTGHRAESASLIPFPPYPREAFAIGTLLGVIYETVRDGERETYVHRFRKNSRPLLASTFDGSRLVIVGGRYRFTERGIVDK